MTAKWAVITGASSGIGKALAFEFGSRGFSVFLTGRNAGALRDVASECERRYRVETRTHAADLTDADETDKLAAALPQCHVLVNNAGFGVKGEFAGTSLGDELNLMRVQLEAMLKLTKAVLPGMLQRGSGRILNVASVYSFSPVPQQSVYAACKAFLLSFSGALGEEIRSRGVTVTTLCPGVTRTEFRARAGIAEKKPDSGNSAEEVARLAVAGTLRGKPVVTPGFVNRLYVMVCRHLPISAVPSLVGLINNRRGVNR